MSEPPAAPKSWQEMRERTAALLLSRTGADVAAWNQRVAAAGPGDEQALREWLAGQGVTGYAQALLVWECFGYPDFLTAGAEELIEGQYADRPELRPVLDAVLAVLPALGPVTVQARKTIVSLVSPRRTFAVVQATTRSRVDLGLRLESTELPGRTCRPDPDGRGNENVYVALGGSSEDRTALTMSNKPGVAIEPVPGDAPAARWEMPVTVRRDDDGLDFAGPFVRGVRDDRHLGLIWGDLLADGTLQVFRGAKLRLVDVDPGLIEQALRPGHRLIAWIRLTDARGNPICARVPPSHLTWSVTADGPG